MSTIKNRLKALRTEKGITQDQLADIINKRLKENEKPISKMVISNWENNKHTIKPDKAQQLADFFGVSVGYLLGYSAIPAVLEKQLSEQEREELLKNPQLADELSDIAWQRYTVKMRAIDNKKDSPVNIEDIKTRINNKYGTNVHGDDAYTAIAVGAGEHDFHFIRLFDELLDLDERDGTYTADLLYKYLILDNDSKRIVSELIDNLPQTNVKSLFSEDNNE